MPSLATPAAGDGFQATMQRAITLHQQGRLDDAAELYRVLLAMRPDDANAQHLLGLVKFAGGATAEALTLIDGAMRAGLASPQLLLNRGLVLNALNRPLEAVASFEQAILRDRNFLEAYCNRAILLATLGRTEDALESYAQALRIAPTEAALLFNYGNLLKELGRRDEALAAYDAALQARPDAAELHLERAEVLRELKRYDDAVASYDRALALRADDVEALCNRGLALDALGRHADAVASYDRALALRPHDAIILRNRGCALLNLKQLNAALATFDAILARNPADAEAHYNRGNVLLQCERFGEALTSYDLALALRADLAEAHNNRGLALKELDRFADAAASHRRAYAIDPGHVEARWNEALLQLLAGDYEHGWAGYEWRWHKEPLIRARRNFPQPLWRGEPIAGQTILIHSEQGLGDTIQFCRYLPLVAATGARVVFEVQPPLLRLLHGVGGVEVIARGDALPHFDWQCPLMSLPRAFATRLETIPANAPYLHAAPDLAGVWAQRLGARRRPRIGLAWAGNADHRNDHNRSIALEKLLPLLDVDADFVSLQKAVRPGDDALLDARDILRVGDALGDFADTAALIGELDLVISVDTSVAHLAGALGRPVWLLVTHVPDWRWLIGRDDSPWYPSARIFRQEESRDWGTVIARAREALDDVVRA
jgi:tetratricopeptide (TPR) repeat protein